MNIWMPLCNKDHARAIQWMQWIVELNEQRGYKQKHHIFLHPAAEIQDHSNILSIAQQAFENVTVEPDREGHQGWPQGPNSAFRQAAWYFYQREPWFYCEPDTAVLVVDGLDRLEAAYLACQKPFMGDIAPAGVGYNKHMSGNAFYPANTPDFLQNAMRSHNTPFDIAEPDPIVANMHVTPLIQHCFEYPAGQQPSFPTQDSLSIIRTDAVFFHRAKGMDLIERLRERKNGTATPKITQAVLDKLEKELILSKAASPNRHIVYTYYDHVPEMPSQEYMLSTWANRWEKAGFTPIVLSRKEAQTHTHFKELETYFKSLPTINPPGYELSCWLRWCAMVQVGGGLHVDYDVLPYGFNIDADIHRVWRLAVLEQLPIVLHAASPCPCALWGTTQQYNNALTWFMQNRERCIKTEQGRPHASDQVAVQSGEPWRAVDVCRQYGGENWASAELIHYCHAACAGRPREQVIPSAEQLRELKSEMVNASRRIANTKLICEMAKPKTWIDGIRESVQHLLTESKASDNNRTRVMGELKKVGLAQGGIKYAPEKKVAMRKATKKRQTAKV